MESERLVDVAADEGGRDPEELARVAEWEGIDDATSDRIALVLVFETVEDRDQLIIEVPELDLAPRGWAAVYRSAGTLSLDLGDERDPSYRRRGGVVEESREVPPEVAEWRCAGLPRFEPPGERISLGIDFELPEERDALAKRLDLTIAKKTRGTLSAWWPPREREDLSSLRFELVAEAAETEATIVVGVDPQLTLL